MAPPAGKPAAPVLDPLDKAPAVIAGALSAFNKRLPVEKVYLHTDKPYYNLGDTLWFKSYLVDCLHLVPSKQSQLLYVELVDDSATVVRRISTPVKEGFGWAQIPLPKKIFHEGSYTLRAYTNWMQNFGEDYVFNQRFYLGVPSPDTWLLNSSAKISHVKDKDELQVELKLNRADKLLSPVAIKKVEVKIYEGRESLSDFQRYIYKETLQTGIDGSLKLSAKVKRGLDGKRMRIEIKGIEKGDDTKLLKLPLFISRDQNVDVQFLPEGGHLVAGLKSVIGFKSLGENGRGMFAAGDVYDSKGNKVASFEAIHGGMGSFEFTPQAGEQYSAKLIRPVVKTFKLPVVAKTGTAMHLINPEQSDLITVSLSGLDNVSPGVPTYLIATSRGEIYYSQKVDATRPEFSVSKKLFPSGLARFTLMQGEQPLNERAVFIDHHDQLNITVLPNKTNFNKRDSVSLQVSVRDKADFPVQGNFSVAVTDDSQVKADSLGNNSISTSLLINSGLKGFIESPGYYLNSKDPKAWLALDNLMLTQGWTGYDWANVFAPAKPVKFEADKGFKITGTVVNLMNKPAINAPVILSSQKPQFIKTGTTDSAGRFLFTNLPQIDSGSFFIQINNKRGKNMISAGITLDKFTAPELPASLGIPMTPWYLNPDSTQLNTLKRKTALIYDDKFNSVGTLLKEVKIHQAKIIPNSTFEGRSNLAFDEQDIKESATMTLYDLLKVKIPGFRIITERRELARHGRVVMKIGDEDFIDELLLDRGKMNIHDRKDDPEAMDELIEDLTQIKVASLKGLEVTLSRSFPLLYKGYNWGIIAVTTKNGGARINALAPGTVAYRPLPILYGQQFYSPKYNVRSSLTAGLDYRSTIYWEPNVATDRNGNARISFYTSDIKSKYTVKIAGVDLNGGIGDGTFKLNEPTHENATK